VAIMVVVEAALCFVRSPEGPAVSLAGPSYLFASAVAVD
jgi:hypothetical protein